MRWTQYRWLKEGGGESQETHCIDALGHPAIINFRLWRWRRSNPYANAWNLASRYSHRVWCWDSSWEPWVEEVNAFNFRLGPEPNHHADVASSDLIEVIVKYWGRNTIRPLADETLTPTAGYLPGWHIQLCYLLHKMGNCATGVNLPSAYYLSFLFLFAQSLSSCS